MRKFILTISAAASIFALTAAGAASDMILGSSNNQQRITLTLDDTVSIVGCADTFNILYTYNGDGAVTRVKAINTSVVPAAVCTDAVYSEGGDSGSVATWKFGSDASQLGAYVGGATKTWTFVYSAGLAKALTVNDVATTSVMTMTPRTS